MERTIGKIQYALLVVAWIIAPVAFAASIRTEDAVQWSPVTLGLCLAGWFLSWSTEWAVEYQQKKRCFMTYVVAHVPRLVIGLVSAGVCYVLLPDIVSVVGTGGKVGAFLCGLASDFVVQRLRGLIPPRASS